MEYKLMQTFVDRGVSRAFFPGSKCVGKPQWFNGTTGDMDVETIYSAGRKICRHLVGVEYEDGWMIAILSDSCLVDSLQFSLIPASGSFKSITCLQLGTRRGF